ncbi:Na+(H+)/acetate symporter ActP [Streptomyces sp. V4I23]|uniref:hypothetical protein n=1 Tax=Streptomyces sp. V4I23 TaxID=3042282 RepID=UPI00277FE191|nr:hypothetical protein [Streptomyces sp. V4I23]MDQ1012122.1 Na+(H+)/acetate symporter ActP [Streptomyces sp. V4I23]
MLIGTTATTLSLYAQDLNVTFLAGLAFAVFPLRNPAIVSLPVGFLLGWLGSVLDTRERGGAPYAEVEVRVVAGARAHED